MPATLTASTVSSRLRKAGFNPLGSGSSRNREGVRVSQSMHRVYVVADLDNPSAAQRMAADVAEALTGYGYAVAVTGDRCAMYVDKSA